MDLDKAIEVAVEYWTRQLGPHPVMDAKTNADSSGPGLADLLGGFLSSRMPPITDAQREAFKQNLCAAIKLDIARYNGRGTYVYLGVDYDPCYMLEKAATDAGIDVGMTRFPWKTQLILSDDAVEVSEGYGGRYRQIYPEVAE